MNKGSVARNAMVLAAGMLLLAAGLLEAGDMARNVSGLCVGIGSGLIGVSIAHLAMARYYAKHPAFRRQQEIEAGDERSIAINNLSKAKAFDMTVRAMMLIPFLLILAGSSLWITLAAVALYVFSYSLRYYYIYKYSKVL
ncbi:phosphatidylglycerophosphate synthase [Paenibacillus forsythiae]|uniref:Phosphatidylglycerophosphate synthase n=1 Tax=Paenibacillus forsythiae TaxID=365616 RepID=A0ABU3H8S1_9BACL|nr:hypothetical protein [Paenibacillus forsythiae]MDT3427225.1 phosphatidylglycerophosphate synthase [Paenibacillus forsythiae]